MRKANRSEAKGGGRFIGRSIGWALPLLLILACKGDGDDKDVNGDTDLAYGECPFGEIWAEPGCGLASEGAPDPACYVACSTGCPEGTVCKTVWLNPCVCPEGETCCDACGGEGEICMDEEA